MEDRDSLVEIAVKLRAASNEIGLARIVMSMSEGGLARLMPDSGRIMVSLNLMLEEVENDIVRIDFPEAEEKDFATLLAEYEETKGTTPCSSQCTMMDEPVVEDLTFTDEV